MRREIFNLFTYEALIVSVCCLSVVFCQIEINKENPVDNCTMLEVVDVPVRLTRLKTVPNSQNLLDKILRKTKQVTEYYNTIKQGVIRVCCKGYRLNETSLLCDIPICEKACPVDMFCIKPNHCGCLDDYAEVYNSESAHWYCAPYCEPPCSDDGNNCVKESYCDGVELSEERFAKEYAFEPEYGEYGHENNIAEGNDMEYDLTNVTTSKTPEANDCPYNHIFYHGKCRFMNLSTIETFDCRQRSCQDPHSVCLTNGTCACQEGYIWIDGQEGLNENGTINEEGFCLQLSSYLSEEDNDFLDYKMLILVAVTALSVLLLIIYLIVKYGCKSKGSLKVDDEHLSCVYKNSPQTVI